MNPKRTPAQIFSAIFGFMLFGISSPCVIAMIHDIITGADNLQGALIVGTFCAFIGLGGLIMMIFGLKKPKHAVVPEELERIVLSVARAHGGRLTIAELAVDTRLSIDQAAAALQHFEHRQACRMHLSDEGDYVYVFPGFTMDKAAAVNPLDDFAVFDAQLGDVEDEVEFGTDGDVDAVEEQQQATAKASQDW